MEQALAWLVEVVHQLGYIGVFLMTLVESTFVPLPSEVTMIPVGYLVQQGKMSLWLVVVLSIAGTVSGACLNYWLAYAYGRKLFLKYGHWFRLTEAKMQWMEDYFAKHGPLSIFFGRLVPGVRHYISFPAGLAQMNLRRFCLYTAMGGGIWMLILIGLGYFLGENQALIKEYLVPLKAGIVGCLLILGLGWWLKHRFRQNKQSING